MSSGANVQITQFGLANKYLTANPDSTFFKSVYRQHTNFALQPIEVTFGGSGSQDLNDENIIDIPPFGDLVKQIYLRVTLPEIVLTGGAPANVVPVWANSTPQAILESAELIVGGQVIQRITGEYCYLQSELRTNEALYPALQEISNRKSSISDLKTRGITYMPLYFYFHWHPSLAIPAIALFHQDIKISVKFRPMNELIQSWGDGVANQDILPFVDTAAMDKIRFTPFVEYVFLDGPERQRFRSGEELTYLIEQTQNEHLIDNEYQSGDIYIHDMKFKQLVKELYFVSQNTANVATVSNGGNDWFNFENTVITDNTSYQVDTCEIVFDGRIKIQEDVGENKYYQCLQPMYYHTRAPMKNIYTYSFALHPEQAQPTGSVNFSRLRSSQLRFKFFNTDAGQERDVHVHATSMNIFKIANGIGGLLFT